MSWKKNVNKKNDFDVKPKQKQKQMRPKNSHSSKENLQKRELPENEVIYEFLTSKLTRFI